MKTEITMSEEDRKKLRLQTLYQGTSTLPIVPPRRNIKLPKGLIDELSDNGSMTSDED